jgi:peptidoglycan-associated lipoprotein
MTSQRKVGTRVARAGTVLLMTVGLGACSLVGKSYEWERVDGPTRAPAPAKVVTAPPASGPVAGSAEDFMAYANDRVFFAFDKSDLTPESRATLDRQAQWLSRYPNTTVRIEGNTDERGTREYNLALGERRAEAVRVYLVSHGLSASRFYTISYGEERPLEPGVYDRNRNAHTVVITTGTR